MSGEGTAMRWMAAGICAAVLAGCSHAAPETGRGPQQRYEQGQAAWMAYNASRKGWRTTPSGLQYKVLKAAPPSAPRPAPGATVTIHYTGTFLDGGVFDSSRERGEPATFPLNRLIKGWQEGVPMMRVGERWLFAIPAELAYGARNRPPIPPNSALLFDIELIAIPAAPQSGA